MVLAATAAVAALSAAPAGADCLTAEAYVGAMGERHYVVGPSECVVDTPWNEGAGRTHNTKVFDVEAGTDIRVPLPPFRVAG